MRAVESLDTTALTEEIDGARLAAFRERHRSDLPTPVKGALAAQIVLAVSVAFLATFFIGIMLGEGTPRLDDWVASGILALLALAIAALPVTSGVAGAKARSGRRQYRLSAFAAANDWDYQVVAAPLRYGGMMFEGRDGSLAHDVVRDRGERGMSVGNQTFTTGSGKNRRAHRWGFATVQIGTPLPHIVLDAKGNNSLAATNLPVSLDVAQRLELEGDFSRHFVLYAPQGYETDALYLFTPDIMARFIDHAAELDVEIVDDRIFLYSKRDLSTLDPAVWEWILATLDALTAKAAQWERWRDARLGETEVVMDAGMPHVVRPPRGVARQGRRLAQKLHWIWIVLGSVAAAAAILSLLSDLWS